MIEKALVILVILGVPAAVAIVALVLRYRQRVAMIRQGIQPDLAYNYPRYPKQSSLFYGLIFTGLGSASFLYLLNNPHQDITFGYLSFGAGIALLVYWKLTASDRARELRFYEEWMEAKRNECTKPQTGVSGSVEDSTPDGESDDRG